MYFDNVALFQHLCRVHYSCFLCERAGIQYQYYATYGNLEEHFASEHFLCEHPSCIEQKFVAFHTASKLADHMRDVHNMSKAQQRAKR